MKLNKYVVALTCTLAAAAHAETNWYVLGSAGVSRLSVDKKQTSKILEAPYLSNNGVGAGLVASSSVGDHTDTGYKLQIGYSVTKNFAIEGGYVDLGQASIKSDTTSTFTTVTGPNTSNTVVLGTSKVKTDWKAKGWNIDAVGIVPITDRISLLAKFGLIQAKVEAKAHSSGYVSGSDTANATHIASIFGVGATYALTDSLSIRAEAESYNSLGNATKTGKADAYLLSAGVSYKF